MTEVTVVEKVVVLGVMGIMSFKMFTVGNIEASMALILAMSTYALSREGV